MRNGCGGSYKQYPAFHLLYQAKRKKITNNYAQTSIEICVGNVVGVFCLQQTTTKNRARGFFFYFVLGRDEWKLFAERLGLNPAEILYLDKRVVNPCDAVLAHSRNQGYITCVGDVYDALVDCDLPVMADLL